MTKAHHTPGPWLGNIRSKGKYPVVYDERNQYVATAEQQTNPSETEANIDLIAAAPQLLEALVALASLEVKGHALIDRLQFSEKGRALSEKINAAIAKAKGE